MTMIDTLQFITVPVELDQASSNASKRRHNLGGRTWDADFYNDQTQCRQFII